MAASKKHEKAASRMACIIHMAYQDESISVAALAEKFDVTEKTIRVDLHQRLAGVIEKKSNKNYKLLPQYRSTYSKKDIVTIIKKLGLSGVIPSNRLSIIQRMIEASSNYECYCFKQKAHEDSIFFHNYSEDLERSIRNSNVITFTYKERFRTVNPYLLVCYTNLWYLLATQDGDIKTFALSRIGMLDVTNEKFQKKTEILKEMKDSDTIWFGKEYFTVRLDVSKSIANFFQRRAVLPRQKIIEIKRDGSLLVETTTCSFDEVIPLIQYWIPEIRVLEPLSLRDKVNDNLKNFLDMSY